MFGVLIGFYVFCSIREHLLISLLSLEFIVLRVFFLFILCLGAGSFYYSLFYLIFTACEGALGLSILVVMGRRHGGDYFSGINMF